MLTQTMGTTLNPQGTASPSPRNEVVTHERSLGDDITAVRGGDSLSDGMVTKVGKRDVGRVTRPDRGLRAERGIFGGR
jgi:hypothetical protein